METNSFAAYDAQHLPGTRLAERLLFTEEMSFSAFLRDSRDFLFGDYAVEDVAEMLPEMGFSSVRQYIRTMGVDVKKLVHAAKVYKSITGFSPRLLTRREKAEQGAMSEHERLEYAVNREHYGEVNFGEENSDTDWNSQESLAWTNLREDSWWAKSVTMKPFKLYGTARPKKKDKKKDSKEEPKNDWVKLYSGIRISVGKHFNQFTVLKNVRNSHGDFVTETVMLGTPNVKLFKKLWRERPHMLRWFQHRASEKHDFVWCAAMEIQLHAHPYTGRKFQKPTVGYLWAYVSEKTMKNKKAVEAIKRLYNQQKSAHQKWSDVEKSKPNKTLRDLLAQNLFTLNQVKAGKSNEDFMKGDSKQPAPFTAKQLKKIVEKLRGTLLLSHWDRQELLAQGADKATVLRLSGCTGHNVYPTEVVVEDNGEVWRLGARGHNNHISLDPAWATIDRTASMSWEERLGRECFAELVKLLLDSNGEF